MDPGNVGRIEQVVGHVEVVAVERHRLAAIDAPGRVIEIFHLENVLRVGLVRLAHPDPEQAVALMDGVGTHLGDMGNTLCTRDARAGARTVEGQAVIAAFHVVALDTAHGERQLAMGTGILQRGGLTILQAVKNDLFAEDGDGLQLAAYLVIPGRDVPGILEKHLALLAFCQVSVCHFMCLNKLLVAAFFFRKTELE